MYYLTIREKTTSGSGDGVPVTGGGAFREERTRTGWGTRSHESMSIDVTVRVGGSATQIILFARRYVSRCIHAHRKPAMIHS